MDDKKVFETATTILPQVINEVLASQNCTVNDVKYIIAHQSNIEILREIAKRINVSFEEMLINMDI